MSAKKNRGQKRRAKKGNRPKKAKAARKAAPKRKAPPAAKAKPPARQAKKAKPAARATKGASVAKGRGAQKAVAQGKAAESARPGAPTKPTARKGSRRQALLRRGPDGEILAPGDLLLPGGTQSREEVMYLFRGCAAAERPVGEEGITEVLTRRTPPDAPPPAEREELARALEWARTRFGGGAIDPFVPPRTNVRRNFPGVVERARQRRREIGAFLRGLDLGHTETSHMDAHGEASLQSLMEWAARLENLVEADEPVQADYNQFHRGLDQLESTTEALIIDVEQTLRRLRDRLRS